MNSLKSTNSRLICSHPMEVPSRGGRDRHDVVKLTYDGRTIGCAGFEDEAILVRWPLSGGEAD